MGYDYRHYRHPSSFVQTKFFLIGKFFLNSWHDFWNHLKLYKIIDFRLHLTGVGNFWIFRAISDYSKNHATNLGFYNQLLHSYTSWFYQNKLNIENRSCQDIFLSRSTLRRHYIWFQDFIPFIINELCFSAKLPKPHN